MIVISIGSDKKICEPGSASRARMIEYGTLFDELHLVIFSNKKRGCKEERISPTVWVHPTSSRSKIAYMWDAFMLGRKIVKEHRNLKSSTVVTCQDPFEAGVVGWFLKMTFGIALHIQVHIDFFSPYFRSESVKQHMQSVAGLFIIRRANAVRVVSKKIKDYLVLRGVSESSVSVLPIHTDVEKFATSPVTIDLHKDYPQYSIILLVMSRLVKQKNVPCALFALKQIAEKYPDVGLVIVGSGPEEQTLKNQVRNLGLSNNVQFKPWATDVASYYKTADIFLLPSNYEGWGMTALEASACGLPVVMTDVGCAGECVKDGANGLVVPVGDENAFAHAVMRLVENPEERKRIADGARKLAESCGSRQSYLRAYRTSLEQAIMSHKK